MSRLKERLIAYALVFCTLATAIGSVVTLPVRAEEAIGEGTIGLTGYTIEIKNSAGSWEPLTDSHTVRNGDELRIAFNWELANGDTSADLVADITPLAGILLGDSSHRALPDVNNGNQIIGEYWVENNKLHIRLTDENYIQHTGERKGGATITGTVKVEDAKDGQKVTVQIGSTSVSPNFTTGEPVSGASVQKWAMGSLEAVDGGAYRQKYGLKIETWWNSGEIREISVDDILGEGLENMSEFTVESSGSGLFQAGESYTLEEINQILRGQSMGSLSGQESVTFSYTADVKAGYESGALEITPGDAYKNTATLRYTNNKDEEKTESSSAVVAGSQPSIDKSDGILSGDGKTITWNVGNVAAGATASVSFQVRIPAVSEATTWKNIASTGYGNNPENPTPDDPDYDPQNPNKEIPTNEVEITEEPVPPTPSNNPRPSRTPTTEIPDNPTPLAEFPDSQVPLSNFENIEDEDVPLAFLAPATGDDKPVGAAALFGLIALGMMGAFGIRAFKKDEEES